MGHRLQDEREVAGDARGHEQDGAGGLGHDPAGRLHAVHARHDEVHEDGVGPVEARLRTAAAPSSTTQATV